MGSDSSGAEPSSDSAPVPRVDPVAGELVGVTPGHVEELAIGVGGKRRRPSRSLDLIEFFERAGVGVLAENQDAVVARRGYVDEDGHVSQYLSR